MHSQQLVSGCDLMSVPAVMPSKGARRISGERVREVTAVRQPSMIDELGIRGPDLTDMPILSGPMHIACHSKLSTSSARSVMRWT